MKRARFAITVIPLLLVTSMMLSVASVWAHTPPWKIPTYAYLEVFPSPIGVGQSLFVFGFMDKYPPTASGAYGDRWTMELIIIKPDNTKEVRTYKSDPVGCIFDRYTPTQTGTYKFQLHFPEQVLKGENLPPEAGYAPGFAAYLAYINDIFLESYSRVVEVVVQSEPIPEYTPPPLPSGYWTRPVSQENQGWGQILGNWLALGWQKYPYGMRINPYSWAPETAHIVWTRPITFGGIVDGQFGDIGYYTGISYERYWTPPIVMLGRLYYNEPCPPRYGFYCIDIRTGEEIWWRNSTGPKTYEIWFFKEFYPQIRFGQLLDYESPNQHGIIAYIWATYSTIPTVPGAYGDMWYMFDAWTGHWICTIKNVPSGTTVLGPDGSILIYQLNTVRGWLALWNSSRAIWEAQKDIGQPGIWDINEYWMWRPRLGEIIDGRKGYSWNVTIPKEVTGSIVAVLEDRILGTSGLAGLGTIGTPRYSMWCISLKKDELGKLMWLKWYDPPAGNLTLYSGPVSLQDGVFTIRAKETRQWWCYSLEDGNLLWGPSEPETDLHMYGVSAAIAYGKLISADSVGGGGTVYCYDIKTGKRLWVYETENLGLGGYWPRCTAILGFIADKKVYLYTDEHSPGPTLWPGGKLRCVDIETGKELWKISFWGNGPIIADGYLIDLNAYDNQIYCFGKGRTRTTVSVGPKVAIKGMPVVIEGTVIDESPGCKGTPAVADEDMSAWMEYVYMQKPMPQNVKGVEVELYATNCATGETTLIGTVRTDPLSSGLYFATWTPQKEGTYVISAVFKGSKGYYDSYAFTSLHVSVAPEAGAPAQPTMATTDLTPLITTIIVIVIICVCLVIYDIIINRKILRHSIK